MEFEGVPYGQDREAPNTGNTSEVAAPPSMDGSLECNICLDSVVDPIVTLCGHLYCWPCIYRWMQLEGPCHQQCPVCKALLSEQTLVPLYGRGTHSAMANSDAPQRPTFRAPIPLVTFDHDFDHYQPMQEFPVLHPGHYQPRQRGQAIQPCSPVVGGLAIATLNMMCGNRGVSMHGPDHPHHLTLSGGNPRLRRQLKQVEKSLRQIWLLLVLFAVVCLFLF